MLMLGGYVLIPLGVFVHERRRLGQPRVTPHAIFVGVLAARGPAAALLSRFEVAACASPAAHDAGEQGLSFDRRRGG